MDPDVVPLHSSSPPPPPGDDGDGDLGSEDDEFGDFGGFSCSAEASDPPHPSFKPATHQTTCSFNQTVEQSQPTSTVNLESEVEEQESSLRLTNGFSGKLLDSGAAAVGASSPEEETGFADFTVFSEQDQHPWCCGFSPMSSSEPWSSRAGRTHQVIKESEPRANKHCENRDAASEQTSQDHLQAQDAAASGEEEPEREPRFGLNPPQTSEAEVEEEAKDVVSRVLCESDPASFSDDLSFEGISADLEPNVSSLDQTDFDRTDDEDEELCDSLVDSRTGSLSRPESERGFHLCDQHATQETRSTSNQPGAAAEDGSADGGSDLHRDREVVQTADSGLQVLGNLPPSDSFADFCSAPTQDDGQSWAEFKDQSGREEGKGWMQNQDLDQDQDQDLDLDQEGQHGGSRRNSCQASLCCRVQQLLQTSFPEVLVPAVEGEEELLGLHALLQTPHLSEEQQEKEEKKEKEEKEAAARLRGALWLQEEMLSPHRDVHSAVGLRFQWGGSHTNRTLLRCLGVDTKNIVFFGSRKQPVTVPAFASGLGMLEPTKDCVPTVGSAGQQDKPEPSTRPVQEELPSRQLDWSSRGLSSSQDGCSALNLDYFGPEEEIRSSISPPPGVDPELYELTISKLETSSISQLDDALNRLMSTTDKTCISLWRKPVQDEQLSDEAFRLISGLPNMSFMQAKVLMFPSILVPEDDV